MFFQSLIFHSIMYLTDSYIFYAYRFTIDDFTERIRSPYCGAKLQANCKQILVDSKLQVVEDIKGGASAAGAWPVSDSSRSS